MKDDRVLVLKCPDKFGHLVVVRVRGDVLTANDVATYEVIVPDVDDGKAGVLGPNKFGELLAGDALQRGDSVG